MIDEIKIGSRWTSCYDRNLIVQVFKLVESDDHKSGRYVEYRYSFSHLPVQADARGFLERFDRIPDHLVTVAQHFDPEAHSMPMSTDTKSAIINLCDVVIVTDGPSITSTSYWTTIEGSIGLSVLAVTADVLFVLLAPPPALLGMFPRVGTPCQVSYKFDGLHAIYRLTWNSEPEPFTLDFDAALTKRVPAPFRKGHFLAPPQGTTVPLIWYGPGVEPASVVELRREVVHIAHAL